MIGERYRRRSFLRQSLLTAFGAPLALALPGSLRASETVSAARASSGVGGNARVAIVSCRSYGAEVRRAFAQSFDLLGGIGPVVKDKTVTIKLNLTGTSFAQFMGRAVGETYMTHPDTVMAVVSALFSAGARRVRLVESTNSRAGLETTLSLGDWDVRALSALGKVEYENTRNLGQGKSYAQLRVPGKGYVFSAVNLNHAYEDTDVMVSMAKLKNHVTAGVTLSMKNMFGVTPNSLYGSEAGSEDATSGRSPLHGETEPGSAKLPGLRDGVQLRDSTATVPRIVADVCAARPVHLAIIDGITSMSGGEGPWCGDGLKFTSPGVLIVGFNPVSTDAVGTGVMGYADPRAARGRKPFHFCDNHLLLAEQAGLGTADLAQIDVRGLSIEKARHPYAF
jgi:uncharacterized protein (DUF362 family)